MLRTLLRDESHQFRVIEDPSAISDIVEHKDRLLWLDLESPTAEDFALISEEFRLHPLAIEDAMARHQRPKVDPYENFYLVIFYSVGIEEPGESRLQGRRGLQGTTFIRPTANGVPEGEASAGAKPDVVSTTPAVEREGDLNPVNGFAERIVLRELTLFMGQNFLITVHDHPIDELEEAAKRWTRNIETIAEETARPQKNLPGTRNLTADERTNLNPQAGSQKTNVGPHISHNDRQPTPAAERDSSLMLVPTAEMREAAGGDDSSGMAHHSQDIGILLYSLLDTIVDNYFPVIDSIVDRIETLEESIFERYNQQAIEAIFILKKDLLALRKVLAPERDVLNILTRRDIPIFDDHTLVYFQDVYDHVVRVTDSIDTYRDLLSSALDSFLSMQSNRLNITVQTLTSVSIMMMSVATVTGWFGMNFEFMPELHTAWGYPAVILFVVAIIAVEVLFFKRKGWL